VGGADVLDQHCRWEICYTNTIVGGADALDTNTVRGRGRRARHKHCKG